MGGYVCDLLRDVPGNDLGIAVQADSMAVAKELAGVLGGTFIPLGHQHRLGRVVVSSPDAGSSDRWTVDVSPLKGSVAEDLGRRDFTIDAMAIALEDWPAPDWRERVVDPFGGKKDLSDGVIRAVKPAVFQDDPIRLLRAPRLAAVLGFRIEPQTRDLIVANAHLLSEASAERVRDEFLLILSLHGAKLHLETLDDMGLLCCIIPELGTTRGVEQPKEHYWDVFGHSINAVEGMERVAWGPTDDPVSRAVPWNDLIADRFAQELSDGHTRRTLMKLAALLHDISKPQTKTIDDTGRTRFFGHHTLGSSTSAGILERLRVSGRGVQVVSGMVEGHLRPMQMSQGDGMPTPRAVYRYFRDVGDPAIDTLYLSLADHLAARGPELDMAGWERHAGIIDHILAVGTHVQSEEKMPRLVTGHDLIHELGLVPGPLIGSLLEELRDAEVTGELDSRDAALDWARQRLQDSPDTDTVAAIPAARGAGG